MARYSLVVSFPLNLDAMIEQTAEVSRIVGSDNMDGAGAGMGYRDVSFSFDSKAERYAAVRRFDQSDFSKMAGVSFTTAEYEDE